MVPKRELICVSPYLSKTSLDLRTMLRQTIEGIYHLKVTFKSKCILNTLY